MQEGTPAFVQMVAISKAVVAHKAAGPALPGLPAAPHHRRGLRIVGLARPRHRRGAGRAGRLPRPAGLRGAQRQPFPAGRPGRGEPRARASSTRSWRPRSCAGILDRALRPARPRRRGPPRRRRPRAGRRRRTTTTWESVTRTRRPDRPGVRELLRHARRRRRAPERDRGGRARPGAAARAGPVRRAAVRAGRPGPPRPAPARRSGPAALREARRGMRLAEELGLPLVRSSTPRAPSSRRTPRRARWPARSPAAWPTSSRSPCRPCRVMLGQGYGGGALALLPADRVIAAQHAWLSPLPPEGASAIVHRDTDHAAEMAARAGRRAVDLLARGIVDRIVAEQPGAPTSPRRSATGSAPCSSTSSPGCSRPAGVACRAGRALRLRSEQQWVAGSRDPATSATRPRARGRARRSRIEDPAPHGRLRRQAPPPAAAARLRTAGRWRGPRGCRRRRRGSASPSRRRCGGGRSDSASVVTWRTTISPSRRPPTAAA